MSYSELLAFQPFANLFADEESAVVRHVRDLERRIFNLSTPVAEVERLRAERAGVIKVLEIVQALAQKEAEEASQPVPATRQRLADTLLPRRL